MSYKSHFSRFLADAGPSSLHFAAHSHHYWPDVTREAQLSYWDDSCKLADSKWGPIFCNTIPATQSHIARILNLPNSKQIAFATNTHELLTRLMSALPLPLTRPMRILTTSNEFHSFKRQAGRLEEEGLVHCTKLDANALSGDRAAFVKLIIDELNSEVPYDLLFMSHVFFDSGLMLTTADLKEIATQAPSKTCICIDGYHSFMAIPLDFSDLADRVFYLSGGYKYAMSGEGCCFMVCPRGDWRPIYTGWFAEMGELVKTRSGETSYSNDGGAFSGSTMDFSSFYRFNAVQQMLVDIKVDVDLIHRKVVDLQAAFLSKLPSTLPDSFKLVNADAVHRGHFLAFEIGNVDLVKDFHQRLEARGVKTDFRGTRLRFGFALYHDLEDVEKLAAIVNEIVA